MSTDWPDEIELRLDGIAQGGEGVGRWGERVVFARGGLPGERVRVALGEHRAAYARGAVVEVLEASPDRVEPRDPGADHMPWQHVAYAAQLRYKRQILAEQLAKIGGLDDVPVDETVPASPPWEYRSAARFHGEGQRVGYHSASSRDLREVAFDPLALPALNAALGGLRRALDEEGVAGRFEVLLRASETHGYVLAELRGDGELRFLATRWRAGCPGLAGVRFGSGPGQALGAAHLMEELGGVAFQLRPGTFFQVNLASAEALLALVRAGLALRGGERLLDLYCGAGAFALPLARGAAQVIGVEASYEAVEDARASAALNEIANVRFLAGQVERELERLAGQGEERFDGVVLDPPRRGCHPQALAGLARLRAPRVVYVSCQPATLARDLKELVGAGYRVARVTPVDLFPQTPHIESVCVLLSEEGDDRR